MTTRFGPFVVGPFVADVVAQLHPGPLFRRLVRVEEGVLHAGAITVPLASHRGVSVLGLGKAAVPQVEAVRAILAASLPADIVLCRSLAITKRGSGGSLTDGDVIEATHPVCDESSLAAAHALVRRVANLPEDQLVLLCLSGGGSALATSPRPPFSLDDKRRANRALLDGGASIVDTNLVRQEMSAIKNGGLLRACTARRVLALVTVDVPSDDLSLVASGPTAWRARDVSSIAAAAHRFLPADLAERVVNQLGSSERADWQRELARASREHASELVSAADWTDLARIAERALRTQGFRSVVTLAEPLDMPIDAGLELLCARLPELARLPRPAALLSGGELTVEVQGKGRGGRNTEFVLRAARELFHRDRGALDLGALSDADREALVVLSFATDGSDGPTDSAGGVATRRLVGVDAAAREALAKAIAQSDSLGYLEARGAALRSGPTHTNLMDLRVLAFMHDA